MIQHDGAAGENESPDSHPDHCGQENARLSGLNIVPRVQVQVVEDMGGHLGSSLADSEYYGSGTVVLAVSFWHGLPRMLASSYSIPPQKPEGCLLKVENKKRSRM